jgi:hypothetical protein
MTTKQIVALALTLVATVSVHYLTTIQAGGPLLPTDPRPYVIDLFVFITGTLVPAMKTWASTPD